MLSNELLDVQKLDDTAENEPLEVPKIRSLELTRQGVNDVKRYTAISSDVSEKTEPRDNPTSAQIAS